MSRTRPLTPEERWQIGATRLGITFAEYRTHIADGKKWCVACQRWQPRAEFQTRTARPDGLDNICREIGRTRARRTMAALRAERKAS